MNRRLKKCPVCNGDLQIVEYKCPSCITIIRGEFGVGDFAALSAAQQQFVKTFICCSGNIREVEKKLKISYPTVKNRLAEVQKILCEKKTASASNHILDKIEAGEISVEEAIKEIKQGR
jgi:hypothetical protein